jgi:aspartyl-tRNA(Asn)/glutamyl-tRNA(Gln) amidotransferase subunit C
MSITRSELEWVTGLARLQLSDEEAENLARDCRSILDYFEAIRELDVANTVPEGALERPTPTRKDIVDPDPLERPPRKIAPDWRDGFFVLPRLAALNADAVSEADGE